MKNLTSKLTRLSFFPPLTRGRVGWGFCFVFFLFFAFYESLFAADIFFESQDKTFFVGDNFLVEVFLDAKGESVNTVSSKIMFDPDALELKEVRDGNSSINFWIEKPINKDSGEIVFSGITPGGLSSSKNFLFSLVFGPKKTGDTMLGFKDVVVLKNDGSGGQAKTQSEQFDLKIMEGSGQPASVVPQVVDKEPPEDFKPLLGIDPEIFEGKYFLIFSTTDKGGGIDHYEVREGIFGKYIRAESPYLIKDQSLHKDIYVKAVDRASNERVAVLEEGEWYQRYSVLGIIIFVVAVLWFVFKKLWPRLIK